MARVVLVLVLATIVGRVTAIDAAAPTPVATSARDAAPAPPSAGPPAAPTKAILLGGAQVFWEDNSDNEQGFRIAVTVTGGGPDRVGTYEAPRDAVSFILPPDAPRVCDVPTAYTINASVVAFNRAGESTPSREGIAAECYEPAPLTTPDPQLPSAGRAATHIGTAVWRASLRSPEWPCSLASSCSRWGGRGADANLGEH